MKAYELAKAEVGTVEWRDGHNPKVLAYFNDAGHGWVGDDETAWCAAFVGAMLKRAGMQGTGKLTARSYLEWGRPVDLAHAREGDIVVFKRGNSSWQGHVAFFVRRAGTHIEVLGGNQSDAVKISRYAVADLLGVRRAYVMTPPVSAQPIATPVALEPLARPSGFWPAFVAFLKAMKK